MTVAWNLVDLVFQLAFYSYLQCHWLKCETLVLPLSQGNCKKGIEFLTGVCSVYQARAQSCSNTKFPYIQRTVAVYICSCIVHVSRKQKNQIVCSIMSRYRLYAGMMEAHIFFLDHKCTADTKMLNPMRFLLFAHPDLIFINPPRSIIAQLNFLLSPAPI